MGNVVSRYMSKNKIRSVLSNMQRKTTELQTSQNRPVGQQFQRCFLLLVVLVIVGFVLDLDTLQMTLIALVLFALTYLRYRSLTAEYKVNELKKMSEELSRTVDVLNNRLDPEINDGNQWHNLQELHRKRVDVTRIVNRLGLRVEQDLILELSEKLLYCQEHVVNI